MSHYVPKVHMIRSLICLYAFWWIFLVIFPLASPDWLETFQIFQKLSRMSGNFPDCPETFWIFRKLSRLSSIFPDCLETFQTFQKLSRLILCFDLILGQFCRYAQKLSGRGKTFWSSCVICGREVVLQYFDQGPLPPSSSRN